MKEDQITANYYGFQNSYILYSNIARNFNNILFLSLLKVDYQTKTKNRSRALDPVTLSAPSTKCHTVISGVTSSSDFNGPINHHTSIAVVPPMKSNLTRENGQRTMENMSLPLTSTASTLPCHYDLNAGK